MSVAHLTPSMAERGSSRWLLLGSLALNLFFIGVAIAMAVRAPAAPTWDRKTGRFMDVTNLIVAQRRAWSDAPHPIIF